MPRNPAVSAAPTISREALLKEHLGLVHHVARRMMPTLTAKIEFDDLVSAGTMGLIQAVDAFDTGLGHSFSSFAVPRIRGAMLDALRRQDHVPRGVRHRAREVAAARNALVHTLGRFPYDSEIAAHLGVTVEVLWSWQRLVDRARLTSIDQPRDGSARGGAVESEPRFAELATTAEDGIEAHLERTEDTLELYSAVAGMEDQAYIVIALHYFAGLAMCEIAPMLGVTGSRVSQIHKQALQALRGRLAA